jgi:hypothetical protein
MKATTFSEFKTRKMLDLLAEVTALVKSGEGTGLLVSVKRGDQHHSVGLLGEYLDDPALVLTVTARIDYRINQLIDDRLVRQAAGGDGSGPKRKK